MSLLFYFSRKKEYTLPEGFGIASKILNILIKYLNSHNVAVEWISETLSQSFESELVEDILSIIASFSSKIYGKRASENKKKKKNDKTNPT